MSVPLSKQGLSDLELYHNAISLRRKLTFLLLRDFGIKDKVRNTGYFRHVANITEEDRKILEDLSEKYNIANPIIEEYPAWFLDFERKTIMDLMKSLIENITSANSIHPTTLAEYDLRREFEDKAICNCEVLLQEFQYVIRIIPIDIEKFKPYVESIDYEVTLLKGWRKSDNRLLKAIKKRLYPQQVESEE